MISTREAYGAYTKFAAEMAMLAITVAKIFTFTSYLLLLTSYFLPLTSYLLLLTFPSPSVRVGVGLHSAQFMVSSLRSKKSPPQLAPTSKR